MPIYLLRQASSHRLRLVIDAPIEARRGSAPAAAAAAEEVTRRVSASLERQVRAHPEQWLWLHDRWKRAERMLLADEPGGSFRAYRSPAQRPADAARVSSPR